MATQPARLGIHEPLLARYTAAGWVMDGEFAPAAERLLREVARGPDPGGARIRLAAMLEADPALASDMLSDPALGDAAVVIAGASRVLADTAATDPEALRSGANGQIAAISDPDPDSDLPEASRQLRSSVRRALLGIAVGDLTQRLTMPEVGRELADLADEAAVIAMTAALRLHTGIAPRMAIIAMGKWGGRELNYASDIDVLFVYEGGDEEGAAARRIAESFIGLLDRHGDGAYRVDADLRPEGRMGPLARTLDSYRAYWERWAETWEMQALLKARPVAGDRALGDEFIAVAQPFVFPETLGAEAVREIRSMKTRAEQQSVGAGVEIKRGVGGIRDVEFAVQLLQLVHGRSDPGLRGANTLDALGLLGEGGYVHPQDAAALTDAYHWLRDVEHRLQLFGLQQTHTLPTDPSRLDRIARAMGYRDEGSITATVLFDRDLVARRSSVRTIHERLFYRPVLEAFAASPAVRLTEEGAARQLAALGYSDTAAARKAFTDLTGGLSRRSRLMQQMLPLMLSWLSDSPDPDLGLSQLRLLVTASPDNADLIAALRDSPVAAERLCALLGTSRLLGRLVDRVPSWLGRLGSDSKLAAFPDAKVLIDEAERLVHIRSGRDDQVAALRRFAHSNLMWIAGADLIGSSDHTEVGIRLTAMTDALVTAALHIATGESIEAGHRPPDMAVIAMGKWGGSELNYASDFDALLVHAPGDDQASAAAVDAAERFVGVIDAVFANGPGRGIDLDLRPEGTKGPLVRSLDSYRAYYDRWADTWEFHALLRARPVAGAPDLGGAFMALVEPLVYRPEFGDNEIAAIRAMKARVESERIPPSEDPAFHMKLGRGGMADVEWTAQLLQLRHGASDSSLREAGTISAIDRLEAGGHLGSDDADVLRIAYGFCAGVRNRLYLQAGRARDSLPVDPLEATRLARSLGYGHEPRTTLREDYRRSTRRARRVVDRVFYGLPAQQGTDPDS